MLRLTLFVRRQVFETEQKLKSERNICSSNLSCNCYFILRFVIRIANGYRTNCNITLCTLQENRHDFRFHRNKLSLVKQFFFSYFCRLTFSISTFYLKMTPYIFNEGPSQTKIIKYQTTNTV